MSTNNYGSINILPLDDTEIGLLSPKMNQMPSDDDNNDSESSMMFSILNTLLGVSLFAIPWGFALSGSLGGLLTVSIVAYFCYETIRILLVSQGVLYYKTKRIMSYPEMVGYAMNEPWPGIVKMATLISCLGGCIGYLIFLSELCWQLFGISQTTSVIVATIPLMALSLLRGFRELAIFAVIGFWIIVIALLIIVFDGFAVDTGGDGISHILETPLFGSTKSIMKFLGPATFTFTVHYMLTAMGAEFLAPRPDTPATTPLSSPAMSFNRPTSSSSNRRRDNDALQGMNAHVLLSPLASAFTISCCIIIVFGITSNALFRQRDYVWDDHSDGIVHPGCEHVVCQNILMNLSKSFYRSFLGAILLPLIFVTYTFVMAPAREHVEKYFMELEMMNEADDSFKNIISTIVRVSLVIITAIIAAINPYFGSTLGAVGGITDAFQSFVLPCLIYLSVKTEFRISSGGCTILYYLITAFGCCLITFTVVSLFNVDIQ